nr:MAG TPA: hypothetical protein [Caudoviricetes sp.]
MLCKLLNSIYSRITIIDNTINELYVLYTINIH